MLSISKLTSCVAVPSRLISRTLSTTATTHSQSNERPTEGVGQLYDMKWNFGHLHLRNKRYLPEHKKMFFNPFKRKSAKDQRLFRRESEVPKYFKRYEYARGTGIYHHAMYEHVPEMVPELVVPDLGDCQLKPYVSYRTKEIYQEPLTAKDLFNAVYGKKIISDFQDGKLDGDGQPLEPSEEERLTPEEAELKARQTGSDIFEGGVEKSKLWNVRFSKK